MTSTSLQNGVVADFLEDLARFATDEEDRLQLLQAAVGFRSGLQNLTMENEAFGHEAA